MKYGLLFLFFALLTSTSWSQIALNAIGTPYIENFSGLTCSPTNGTSVAWTNNSNLAGWYAAHTSIALLTQLSGSPRSNTGKLYTVIDAGDISLGSRASGGTGTITYGVRLRNSTGSAISSLYVSYFGEQWSIAENGTNVNNIAVSYQVGAAITSTTAGTWTSASGLDFTQIFTSANSAGMGGTACTGNSAQCLSLNGNVAANRQQITLCLDVSIPVNQEIMIRWVDVDDGANDHHMQIDDVSITPYSDICSVVLPLGWGPISVTQNSESSAILDWTTFTERNNDRFNIEVYDESSHDFKLVSTIESKGDNNQSTGYQTNLDNLLPGVNIGRIQQVDNDGKMSFSPVFEWEMKSSTTGFHYKNNQLIASELLLPGTGIQLVDLTGRIVKIITIESATKIALEEELGTGIFIIQMNAQGKTTSQKIVVQN